MSSYSRRKRMGRINNEAPIDVDYKDVTVLKNYITETGKILPSRITGAPARYQRQLSRAIERARFLGLLPYCDSHR